MKAHDKVGIYSPNTPEWMLTIQACNRSSCYVGQRPNPPIQTDAIPLVDGSRSPRITVLLLMGFRLLRITVLS